MEYWLESYFYFLFSQCIGLIHKYIAWERVKIIYFSIHLSKLSWKSGPISILQIQKCLFNILATETRIYWWDKMFWHINKKSPLLIGYSGDISGRIFRKPWVIWHQKHTQILGGDGSAVYFQVYFPFSFKF